MKIAISQMNSQADWGINLAHMGLAISQAARAGAQAVLFPENALYMGPPAKLLSVAKEIKGGALPQIQTWAKREKIAVLVGSYPEWLPNCKKKVLNTSVWFDEKGRELGRYRKIHLFDVTTPQGERYRESQYVLPGKKPVVFAWKGLKIGMSICYDLRFPEHYRALHAQGATLLLVPSAFTYETGKTHWHTLLGARAIENLSFVLAPAQTGKHLPKRRTFGHSLVLEPWGKPVMEGDEMPGLFLTNLNLSRVKALRNRFS